MPELAAACRVLLRTVGIETCWTDRGPDDQAAAWLAAGDRADDRPAELTGDQWTMLRVCWAIWGQGPGPAVAELLDLSPPAAQRFASYLAATALSAELLWPCLFLSQ